MTKKHSDAHGLRTWIEIDTQALAHNYKTIRGAVPSDCRLMSVVKSNAYGHSLVDFSREVTKLGADWLGVDSIVEAVTLRENGIHAPILVLGYTLPEMLSKAIELDISITVSTFELLEEIKKLASDKPLKIHIKVDTGMYRQGFLSHDIKKVLDTLHDLKNTVTVEGLFTHFAAAKNPSFLQSTKKQIEEFNLWADAFKTTGFSPLLHASASGGTFVFPDAHFDMVRVGISMYGLWPSKEVELFSSERFPLKPILSWKTILGEVKKAPKGSKVGYDQTETMHRDSMIAVCPVGYWHGYPRSLSSIGHVLVRGHKARVIGRVSMDMVTIDVTGIEHVQVGEIVTLLGTDEGQAVCVEEFADWAGNSVYEIITRINPLIRRIYV